MQMRYCFIKFLDTERSYQHWSQLAGLYGTVFKKNALFETEVYKLCGSDGRPLLMLLEVLSVI